MKIKSQSFWMLSLTAAMLGGCKVTVEQDGVLDNIATSSLLTDQQAKRVRIVSEFNTNAKSSEVKYSQYWRDSKSEVSSGSCGNDAIVLSTIAGQLLRVSADDDGREFTRYLIACARQSGNRDVASVAISSLRYSSAFDSAELLLDLASSAESDVAVDATRSVIFMYQSRRVNYVKNSEFEYLSSIVQKSCVAPNSEALSSMCGALKAMLDKDKELATHPTDDKALDTHQTDNP